MGKSSNRVLVIIGMHRSMTSLLTQWLDKCGLQVGDDLHGAGIGYSVAPGGILFFIKSF